MPSKSFNLNQIEQQHNNLTTDENRTAAVTGRQVEFSFVHASEVSEGFAEARPGQRQHPLDSAWSAVACCPRSKIDER